MGFFSWKTADTNESISNGFSSRGAFPCKMIDDKGNEWVEKNYEGYGVFGNKDFYELLAEMNDLGSSRSLGIDLAFSEKEKILFPKLTTLKCSKKWKDLDNSVACEFQGYFY